MLIRLFALLAVVLLPLRTAMLTVTVEHDLDLARPAETIAIPWTEISRALPGALVQKLAVRDSTGRLLPYQVTNVAPLARDRDGRGAAYGELLFQHDFAAGEHTATFTIAATAELAPVFPARVFARLVPERLDDFAWENDKIAHRTYGPALAAPAPVGSGKEVLVTSGIDVWCKRVPYPIVDRWYNKGHDHYHVDEGEGMDLFQVGPSRGCGGTGLWDGTTLYAGRNFTTARVLANGPIRAIFELTYDTWAANGLYISETKRFTVDAGHQLDRVESTFALTGAREAVIGIGLTKTPSDRGQDPRVATVTAAPTATLAQWIGQKTNGELGTAVLADPADFVGFAADARNELLLVKVRDGQPVRYFVGAAWSRAGEITTAPAWREYLATAARRAAAPVRVTCAVTP